MTAESKLEVLRAIEGAGLAARQALFQLAVPRPTYYRRRRAFRQRGQPGLHDRPSTRQRTWNQTLPEERDKVLEIALLFPDWSPRQVSCHITDTAAFSASESSEPELSSRLMSPIWRSGSQASEREGNHEVSDLQGG